MATASKIEWTESTWNPIVGCSIVSPGCTHCYAMRTAARMNVNPATPHYHGTVQDSKAGPVWTGKVAMAPDKTIEAPLGWRKSRLIFVNSMGDLFHEAIEDWQIALCFGVMTCAVQHTYQVLTKRAARMRELLSSEAFWDQVNAYSSDYAFERSDPQNRRTDDYRATSDDHDPENPPSNVWLGVSTERQQEADERIPHLLQTPAAVRFISAEPLLGPIDLTAITYDRAYGTGLLNGLTGERRVRVPNSPLGGGSRLDWVIVGGESGAGARPFDIDWARSLMAQCQAAGVPCFVKQLGSNPVSGGIDLALLGAALRDRKGGDLSEWPADLRVREFPRAA